MTKDEIIEEQDLQITTWLNAWKEAREALTIIYINDKTISPSLIAAEALDRVEVIFKDYISKSALPQNKSAK
jgi:hypothetical protein